MSTALGRVLAECLGLDTPPQILGRVAGGDIGESHRAVLPNGDCVFVKRYDDRAAGMAIAEATGLEWLAEAGAIRTPRVLATHTGSPALIVLEWIEAGPKATHHDDVLGRSLAALHRSGAPSFGGDRDNFIGRLPQSNTPRPDWPSFYAQERIEPQVRMAIDAGLLGHGHARMADALIERLPELCGPAEPPARLHGDLWGGNAIVDEAGQPCLIDPAVYGGHREMDLAMMRLFGGFSERVFDAYDDAMPLAPGHEDRVALCQLYPLLVHVNLFGGGYVSSVERILERHS